MVVNLLECPMLMMTMYDLETAAFRTKIKTSFVTPSVKVWMLVPEPCKTSDDTNPSKERWTTSPRKEWLLNFVFSPEM